MDISDTLREEALEIVQALGLLEMLGRYGGARLAGSVALDLVVKPDIDIHLLLDSRDVVEKTKEIAAILIAEKGIREVRITNYLEKKSLKIGVDYYPGRSANWSIDIWITSDPSTTGWEDTDRIRAQLNEENRKKILEIKRFYHARGQLRDGLSSLIYRAVLEDGISDLGRFQEYLENGSDAGVDSGS